MSNSSPTNTAPEAEAELDAGAIVNKASEALNLNPGDNVAVTPPDPFDPKRLLLDQSFLTPGVKTLLTTVPVYKPPRQSFVRVHPHPDYRLEVCAIIELQEDREYYMVFGKNVVEALRAEIKIFALYTAITKQGVVFLWPVKIPEPDAKVNEWHRSAGIAALEAMTKWVRVQANMQLRAYDIRTPVTPMEDPVWPTHSFRDLIAIAFRDHMITSLDHPVVKKLLG